ncbi:MAG: hypothetical protein D6720_09350 [Gammaproteobacteria bacterium]|nr:MAG: hypothetical protein D6720_09350 [Gammaproteobacteria bacterium]
MTRTRIIPIIAFAWLIPNAAMADGAAAEDAVSEILWDYEDSFEYVQYRITDSGHVDMTFASNTPEALYQEIVAKVRQHPDVDSVLAGRDGAACSLFDFRR